MNNFVVLAGIPTGRETISTIFDPSLLQADCTTCWNQFQLDVNPAYVDKMTWEGLKLIGMAIPIPQTGGILKASDLLVGFEILETFLRDPSGRGFELAQAKLAGWGVSNISGLGMKTVIIKPNDPFQFAIPYIAKVPGAKTENLLSEQIAPNSNWSWRTTKWSGWMNSIGNSNLMWISQQTDTYNGTFLN